MGSGGSIGTGVYAWGELGVVEMAFSARRPAEAPEGLSRETGAGGAGGRPQGAGKAAKPQRLTPEPLLGTVSVGG